MKSLELKDAKVKSKCREELRDCENYKIQCDYYNHDPDMFNAKQWKSGLLRRGKRRYWESGWSVLLANSAKPPHVDGWARGFIITLTFV